MMPHMPPPPTALVSLLAQPASTGRRLTVLGADIGQIHDPSAICAVEYTERQLTAGDPLFGEPPRYETRYRLLGSERLPLGTSYPDVARRLCLLAKRLYNRDSRGDYHALIDATGVGRPVVDQIRQSIIPQVTVTAVTLTGGSKGDMSILWRRESSVSKMYLVSRLQAILQANRLDAPRDPLMDAMIAELKVYEIRTKADTGNDEFGAFQVGTHDDLVTALALGCASEIQRVRVGPDFDALPSPVL